MGAERNEATNAAGIRLADIPEYTLEVRENDRRLSMESMPDPFHNTTIRPRGWRAVLAVLRRRYSVTVVVGADRETVERVLEVNPDYTGAPGSQRRREWDAQLQGVLERFGREDPVRER